MSPSTDCERCLVGDGVERRKWRVSSMPQRTCIVQATLRHPLAKSCRHVFLLLESTQTNREACPFTNLKKVRPSLAVFTDSSVVDLSFAAIKLLAVHLLLSVMDFRTHQGNSPFVCEGQSRTLKHEDVLRSRHINGTRRLGRVWSERQWPKDACLLALDDVVATRAGHDMTGVRTTPPGTQVDPKGLLTANQVEERV